MIRINRGRLDNDGNSITPTRAWFGRAQQATQIAIAENGYHTPRRNVYSAAPVRTALEKIFYGKCAYCESELPETDWPVDHYRPARRVREDPTHPGYYWLAYEWNNLYPACFPCNGPRRDPPTFDDPTYGPAAGKWDSFPLTDNRTRARAPEDDIHAERRLLLDPCVDDPAEYLDYSIDGSIFAINGNRKGQKTIEILNLKDRKRLRKKRAGIIASVILLLKVIRCCEANGNARRAADLRQRLEELYTGEHCPLSATARAVVRDPTRFGV